MTRHPDADVLAGYREGLLGRRRSARIRAHLDGCPRCASVDADLAGVTALLAGSPAPSMPSHLIARLDSALAAEVATRAPGLDAAVSGDAAAGGPGDGADNGAASPLAGGTAARPGGQHGSPGTGPASGGTAPSPQQPGSPGAGRHGRWPARRSAGPVGPARRRPAVLGAAAAAAIVLAGAGYGLASLTQQPGGVSAPSSGGASGRSGGGGAAAVPNFGPLSGLRVIASGTDYRPGTLARQAEQALTGHSAASLGPAQRTASAAAGQNGTQAGRPATPQQQACVTLITKGKAPQFVDEARYQGQPAMVIVQAPSAGHPGQVWVAGPACSAQHSDILAHTTLPSSG